MFVKFVGQGELNFEYNGKRFRFTKETPPMDMLPHIYDYVKAARTVESACLQPCEAPGAAPHSGESETVKVIAGLKEENKRLKSELETTKELLKEAQDGRNSAFEKVKELESAIKKAPKKK